MWIWFIGLEYLLSQNVNQQKNEIPKLIITKNNINKLIHQQVCKIFSHKGILKKKQDLAFAGVV